MKKIIGTLLVMFISLTGWSQLKGEIAQDRRKLITDTDFILEGNHNGKIVFDIAIDAKGKVSSVKLVDEETTVKSTPSKIQARNYVKEFTFEPGTWFPKFHQGRVVITMVKPK